MERLLPICALLAACAATPAPPVDEAPAAAAPAGAAALFDLLDGDGDGALSAFEALDVLLVLSEEGESLTRDGLEARLAEAAGDELAERRDFFELGDEDRDGQVDLDELPPMFATMAAGFDADGNGALSWPEFEAADLDDPDLMVRAESAAVYAELTELLGEPARLDAVPSFLAGDLVEYDTDGDGVIALEEVEAMIRVELAGEDFEVDGTVAVMRGVINAATPARVLELAFRHPEVRTLVLADVPGSIDDVANLRAGRYLRELGFDTHVPTGGEVASGGTDLFLAGVRRSAGNSALFGIHSWDGGPVAAIDLPRDHEEHRLYLDYYEEMGIPAAFYWRTLEAAPPEDIHWMTDEELERFGFFTEQAPAME